MGIDAVRLSNPLAYDLVGSQVHTVDARGNISTTVYNVAGQSIASIDSDGNRFTRIYDGAGSLLPRLIRWEIDQRKSIT